LTIEFLHIVKDFISEYAELVNLVSLSFGFAGILLAFVFYRASKPVRQLSYATRTFRIISEKSKRVTGLEIKYINQDVNAISVTRMAIWNGGSETLRNADISENDPLIIESRKGVKILKAEIIESTSLANKSSIKQINDRSNQYCLSFDFLNTKDGVIASFVHDGKGIEDLSLLGSLIGGKIKRTAADPETVTTYIGKNAATTIINVDSARSYFNNVILSMIICSIMLFVISFIANDKTCLAIAIVFLVLGFGMFFYFRRKYPPSQLKMYDDNL